jgi:hypothetical protein
MKTPVRRKRVITCLGTIQLITALSVIAYRTEEEKSSPDTFENYLVIYGLSAPEQQINDFICLIQKIANSLATWKSIVYLTPDQLTAIEDKLNNTSEANTFNSVYNLVGTDEAAEIYLCRNWQFYNQLLINAYRKAQKICYGDGIGIYFSDNSPAFFAAQAPPNLSLKKKLIHTFLTTPKQRLKKQINRVQSWLGFKTILKTVEFDQGYFTLPTFMGEDPPMKHKKISSSYILDTVTSLTDLVNSDYVVCLHKKIGDAPVAVLLTSNFSEAGRMACDDELTAYLGFLKAANLAPGTVLLIKPHPRDDLKKIQQLQERLLGFFADVIVLAEPELFFLPFEIFFKRVFFCSESLPYSNVQSIQVFAVSSACLGLKLLFDVPSTVGFGPEITSRLFYKSYVDGRLAHEHDLSAAIHAIEA